MIVQLKLAGLALAGKAYMMKAGSSPFPKENRRLPKLHIIPLHTKKITRAPREPRKPVPNPLQQMVQGLSSSITRIIQKPPKEDYAAIVHRFLPENATPLTPQIPSNVERFQLADIDGDGQNELITAYRSGDGISTLVLKKHKDQWNKAAEIRAPKYEAINYMTFSDVAGEGKKQLLIGYKTREGHGVLHGYSLQADGVKDLFQHNYKRFEIIEPTQTRDSVSGSQLAFWHPTGPDSYDIEVLRWNGADLVPVQNPKNYYASRALNYYGQKVKQMPNNPDNWYHLADTLVKAEAYSDAMLAIEMGTRLNPSASSADKFTRLKKRISEATSQG